MNESITNGYSAETAIKYTEGQKRFFGIDKVVDGATIVMEEEITRIAEQFEIHTVCDIGCGSNCSYLEGWGRNALAGRVIGVEPSPHMREVLERDMRARADLGHIEITEGDWENIPLPDASVDLVVSRFSLHHLQNIEDGYRELSRVLKVGGHAVISLPHPEYCARELRKQNIEPQEGIPMSVQVFDTTLHYYYHEVSAYLGDSLVRNHIELERHRSFNWGTKDEAEKEIPNTLLFVLRRK